MGGDKPDLSKTISAFTNIIERRHVTDAQRDRMIDEMIKASRADRSVARARAFGMVGVAVGSLGIASPDHSIAASRRAL